VLDYVTTVFINTRKVQFYTESFGFIKTKDLYLLYIKCI